MFRKRTATPGTITALGVALLVGLAGGAQGAAKPVDGLRAAADRLVRAGAPGVLALTQSRGASTVVTSGYGDIRSKAPIRPGDRFRVGSITKTFTATVLLQLVGEGRVALTDTVEQRLPGAIPNGEKVTIRQLLNHSAGLFDYLNDGDRRW